MSDFTDIIGHWAEDDIRWAIKRGLVKGEVQSDGTYLFYPDRGLTRAEYCSLERRKEYVKTVLRKSGPGIVKVENQFNGSIGSGTILRKDGLVLTNHHVINGTPNGQYVGVRLNSSPWFSMGPVVAYDDKKDMALIQCLDNISVFSTVSMSSDEITQGDDVIAVGSPLGLQDTVTKGIISSVERSMAYYSDMPVKLIQVDCAINPGNSGGALLNMNGDFIGIPSVKIIDMLIKDENGNVIGINSVENIGFAIHIDEVRSFLIQNNISL